jgi:hypothetical protein
MECVIPLSVLAKLGKYGVKQYKPYNDAKKLLPEKYQLRIVEEAEVGKAIRIENEEDFHRFFAYFVEELLGRGETVGQRITYEGVPLDKYEKLYRELLECERDKGLYWERLQAAEKLARTLEKEVEELRKEKGKLKEENQQLSEKIRELKERQERLELTRRIEKLLKLAEKLPEEERKEVEDLVRELRAKLNGREK